MDDRNAREFASGADALIDARFAEARMRSP
jgi:hypothetical protein